MPTQLGVPVKLLHECEGHKVSVELTNGEIYRGMMVDAEDCMNMQLQQVVSGTQNNTRAAEREAERWQSWDARRSLTRDSLCCCMRGSASLVDWPPSASRCVAVLVSILTALMR